MVVLVDNDQPAGLAHRSDDVLAVQRHQAAQVHHFGADTLLLQLLGGAQRVMHAGAQADDAHITAFADRLRLANLHGIRVLRHSHRGAFLRTQPAHALQGLVKQVDHRVVVANSGGHQALGVVRVARHHHLHARQMGEGAVEALGVLPGVGVPGTGGGHQHHGHTDLAAGEVGVLRHQVVDGVHAHAEEVDEHQLDDRPHAI
ncbi:hypothetical protein D3C76_1311240 [compost metagenome]